MRFSVSPFGTVTLGCLIDALSSLDPETQVMFDFCSVSPTIVSSYRGYYDHLALGWEVEYDGVTAWPVQADLLANLQAAVGCQFSGYKGGAFIMSRETPLWVDNWGDYSGTGIVGIDVFGDSTAVLMTEKVD